MDNESTKRNERGGVLFLIFIAVALFAALTYVVTKSARVGRGSTDREVYGILSSELTQYPINIRAAVIRIATTSGKGSENVSFDWPGWGHGNYQHPDPQPEANRVFYPAGGGVSFQIPDKEKMLDVNFSSEPRWGSWIFTGSTCIPGIGAGMDANCNTDPTNLELIAILPYVKRELCMQMNMKYKINESTGGLPPVDIGTAWKTFPEFNGDFSNGEALIDAGNELFMKDAGCFEGGGTPPTGSYHFFMTLIHR